MLWLAGLMGLLAAGTVGVLELSATSQTGDAESDNAQEQEPDEDANTVSNVLETLGLTLPDADDSTTQGDDSAPEAIVGPGGAGTENDDVLSGTSASEDILGGDGNDTLNGMGGDDSLHGGEGNDVLDGGDGNDTLFGNNSEDTVNGGAGNDSLQGSLGQDVVDGGDGVDAVHGGLDADTVSGGMGADSVFGGWGNDLVNGVEDDAATAALDDIDDADFLNGGSGDDTIIAGNADIVTAGDGADDIVVGDWIEAGAAASILDFNADDDNILLVYDDAEDVPNITVQASPSDPTTAQVMMDGLAVANVFNAADLAASDVVLMPLSIAQASGIAPV